MITKIYSSSYCCEVTTINLYFPKDTKKFQNRNFLLIIHHSRLLFFFCRKRWAKRMLWHKSRVIFSHILFMLDMKCLRKSPIRVSSRSLSTKQTKTLVTIGRETQQKKLKRINWCDAEVHNNSYVVWFEIIQQLVIVESIEHLKPKRMG